MVCASLVPTSHACGLPTQSLCPHAPTLASICVAPRQKSPLGAPGWRHPLLVVADEASRFVCVWPCMHDDGRHGWPDSVCAGGDDTQPPWAPFSVPCKGAVSAADGISRDGQGVGEAAPCLQWRSPSARVRADGKTAIGSTCRRGVPQSSSAGAEAWGCRLQTEARPAPGPPWMYLPSQAQLVAGPGGGWCLRTVAACPPGRGRLAHRAAVCSADDNTKPRSFSRGPYAPRCVSTDSRL